MVLGVRETLGELWPITGRGSFQPWCGMFHSGALFLAVLQRPVSRGQRLTETRSVLAMAAQTQSSSAGPHHLQLCMCFFPCKQGTPPLSSLPAIVATWPIRPPVLRGHQHGDGCLGVHFLTPNSVPRVLDFGQVLRKPPEPGWEVSAEPIPILRVGCVSDTPKESGFGVESV